MKKLLELTLKLLTTDYCPGANKYVYWLKEPIGWFLIALGCSILIGAFLSPIGWSVASGIAVVTVLGLGFPWLATRVVRCELRCDRSEIHELDETYLLLKVKNRLPLPVIGLVVQDFFVSQSDQLAEPKQNECGLARVPAFSSATYRLPINPKHRGRYPAKLPRIACAFPFGIYTARKAIENFTHVTVLPMLIPVAADLEWSGSSLAEIGSGMRPSDHGEFLGVRQFRRGDSLRSIHWRQSARQDDIIVCERGGPQKSPFQIRLSTSRCGGTEVEAQDNLSWRVRLTASLIDLLVARHIDFSLSIDDQRMSLPMGAGGRNAALESLAAIPLAPWATSDDKSIIDPARPLAYATNEPGMTISASKDAEGAVSSQYISLAIDLGRGGGLRVEESRQFRIDLESPIDLQLANIMQEVNFDAATA